MSKILYAPTGEDVGTTWDTIEAVLIFYDAAFFRARCSRCFLLLSSLCSSVISALRFRCCLFLSSLLALAMLAGVICGAEAYIFCHL